MKKIRAEFERLDATKPQPDQGNLNLKAGLPASVADFRIRPKA